MNKEESHTDLGTIRIHKNVIASIAAIASGEIDGVVSVGKDFKASMLELLRKKTQYTIRVEIDKNGEASLEIPLVIKYGYNLPDVASKVQENVHNALEKMTALSIKDININVQRIVKDFPSSIQ